MATSKFVDWLKKQEHPANTQGVITRTTQGAQNTANGTAVASQQSVQRASSDQTGKKNGLIAATVMLPGSRGTNGAIYAPATQTRQTYNAGTGNNNAPYVAQLNSLYDQIVNRKPFRFDLANDPLYRQAAEQYTLTGRQAMADTMGRAAALTSGYGNSYAQAAAQQANQQYLTQLNAMAPEIWDRQYQAYLNQGDQLLQQYEMAAAHPAYLQALRGSAGTGAEAAVAEQGDSLASADAADAQVNESEWDAYLRTLNAVLAQQRGANQAWNSYALNSGLHNTWSIADLERRIRESQ